MAYRMSLPQSEAGVKRTYADFKGVDFANSDSLIDPGRSAEAVNVYRNYRDNAGRAVQTRPGYVRRAEVEGKINGVHIFGGKALIHHGTKLSLWNTFPAKALSSDITLIYEGLNNEESVSFIFAEKLYILDGQNYYVYGSGELSKVSDNATIPTTRINAEPDGSNGEMYQAVNMLTPKRRNSFTADGESTVFCLDADQIDSLSEVKVWIEAQEILEGFSVNYTAGTVTFTTAPAAPLTPGTANVVIEFERTVSSHYQSVAGCSVAKVFDSRVFLTGNNDRKGTVIHSALSDAAYFPDNAYYNDGDDMAEIKALLVSEGKLFVLKDPEGSESKLYVHTPSLDYDEGKVYPVEGLSVSLGCISSGINFMDEIAYLSPIGLEKLKITSDSVTLSHASYYVDKKLVSLSDYASSRLCAWDGYLVIVCSGNVFLADGLNAYSKYGYEWFWWNGIGVYEDGIFYPAVDAFCYKSELFFTTKAGVIIAMQGTNDDGKAFESSWVTPQDDFGIEEYYKRITKVGGVARIKRIPNSVIKLSIKTDRTSYENVLRAATAGFNFGSVNFGEFTFGTGISGDIVYRISKQKIKNITLKFYSDELDKPFGLYSATLNAVKKGYVK